MIVEICIDSLQGLRAAQAAGAQRVELCAGLIEGGTTPSIGLIESVVAASAGVRVHVLIRPRGGDFAYDPDERVVMRRDVSAAVAAGAHGIVIGALTPAGAVDRPCVQELIEAAAGRPVTFHRAFDHTRDPAAALETLIELGVSRVLTSGQQATAADGAELIGALHRQAAGRIVILAGGGISRQNVRTVVAAGVFELHFSARVPAEVEITGTGPIAFGTPMRTSRRRIAEIVAAAAIDPR
ncbi:MAG TPA: copper homeostasis protein CutC [Mycobacteriales bacterium]|nr:copper homeostasis protein CutC [Mycobacteriales bacterium]